MSSQVLTDRLNDFCFKLYSSLSKNKDGNFFISPLSISTALTMAYVGAANETAEQMKNGLSLADLSNEDVLNMNREFFTNLEKTLGENVALKLANKIFQKEALILNAEFAENLNKHFQSETESVNFINSEEAANRINSWVMKKTENKIDNLVTPDVLDELTMLVLVNAIYFKGRWNYKFNKEKTYEEDFFLKDGSSVKVEMMKMTDKKFHHKINPAGLKACTAEFPYTGRSTAMTIILPHEGISIDQVEEALNSEKLKEVFQHDPMPGPVPIHAYIPKFKMEYKKELAECLQGLGMTHAFDENKADFSLIVPESEEKIFISKVIHQAVVEVSEEGTEAAAATAVVMAKRSMMVFDFPPEEFKCNRPFIFVIHEKNTNGVLFIGKYMSPPSN